MLLAAGLVLRLLTVFAYRPALLYVDSFKYLLGEYPGSDPLGYRLILKVILVAGNLQLVAIIQHLLGLAIAVTLYLCCCAAGRPAGWPRWPPRRSCSTRYQLQIEHMIMPDVWFEALIIAGLAVLLWRPAVTVPVAAAAGLLLGSSATVKQAGELLILPVAVFLLVAVRGWRRALATTGVMAVAFVLPILGYCTVSLIQTGHFWLSAGQPQLGTDGLRRGLRHAEAAARRAAAVPGSRGSRRTARTGSSTPASRRCTRRRSRPARTARS